MYDIVCMPGSTGAKWFYDNGGTEEDLVESAKIFTKLAEIVEQRTDIRSLDAIVTEAGYKKLPLPVRMVLGQAMLNVVVSAFVHGFREAHTKPLTESTLKFEKEEPSWLRRKVKSFLRKVLYALD
jgi:hypothetical protein